MNGSQHICFTDSAGKALFSIPDNGLLCLFYGNGDRHFAVCHRLDDTHAEIDGVNYSLPDFAKRMNIIQQQHLTERTIGLYQIILKFPQSREKQVDTI